MSIVSDALRGKTTWATAVTRIEGWVSGNVNASPTLLAFKAAAMSSVKQGVSNALALADTELGQHFAGMVDGVEAAADAALLRATGGLALPAVPVMNATIKQFADAGRAAFDAWELEQQAKLVPAGLAKASQIDAQGPTPAPPQGLVVKVPLAGGLGG